MNIQQATKSIHILKAQVVENAVTPEAGHDTWQAKVRKTLTGAMFAGLGGFLTWRGIDLLMASHDVGKWFVIGGACLILVGAHIWSGELVTASIKAIAGAVAGAVGAVAGAFKGKTEPPAP